MLRTSWIVVCFALRTTPYKKQGKGKQSHHKARHSKTPVKTKHRGHKMSSSPKSGSQPAYSPYRSPPHHHPRGFTHSASVYDSEIEVDSYGETGNGSYDSQDGVYPRRLDTQPSEKICISGLESFSLMTYNVLCDDYIESHYFPNADPKDLNFISRRPAIICEILALSPDIFVLQELDYRRFAYRHFQIVFESHGYFSFFQQKSGNKSDGCAVFYRSEKFRLIHTHPLFFADSPHPNARHSVALVAAFIPANSSSKCPPVLDSNAWSRLAEPVYPHPQKSPNLDLPRIVDGLNPSPKAVSLPQDAFVLATSHIIYNPKRGIVKLNQIQTLLNSVAACFGECPLALSGDFNMTVTSDLAAFLQTGQIHFNQESDKNLDGQIRRMRDMDDLPASEMIQYPPPPDTFVPRAIQQHVFWPWKCGTAFHPFDLKSAYPLLPPSVAPTFSSYHPRFAGTVDHMWISNQFSIESYLPLSSVSDFNGMKLPTFGRGSDHQSLMARICPASCSDKDVSTLSSHKLNLKQIHSTPGRKQEFYKILRECGVFGKDGTAPYQPGRRAMWSSRY